jgi:hypothetical protein
VLPAPVAVALVPPGAQKRTKKKVKKKMILGLVGSSKVNQTYVEVRSFFF